MFFRHMLKSKIDRAIVSKTELYYKGSIGIDTDFLDKADILPGEKVTVLNTNNGERFDTYALEEPRGSKNVILYGPCARKGAVGDSIIVLTYGLFPDDEAKKNKPQIVVFE